MKVKVTHMHNFESYEMGYWRKMEKIGYKNEVLHNVKDGPGVACATSRAVPESIPGGVTGDFFRGFPRQNYVP